MLQANKVVKLVIKILLMILLWVIISDIPIGILPLKDGGIYRLDENYELWGWPGRIYRYDSLSGGLYRHDINDLDPNIIYNGNFDLLTYAKPEVENKIKEDVVEFAVLSDFIVVNTKQGWQAVSRSNHKTSEIFSSVEQIKNKLGVSISNSDITSKRPWGRLRWFWVIPVTYVIVGLVLFLLFFRKNLIKVIHKKDFTK